MAGREIVREIKRRAVFQWVWLVWLVKVRPAFWLSSCYRARLSKAFGWLMELAPRVSGCMIPAWSIGLVWPAFWRRPAGSRRQRYSGWVQLEVKERHASGLVGVPVVVVRRHSRAWRRAVLVGCACLRFL